MAVFINDLYDRLENLFSDGEDELTAAEQTIATKAFDDAYNMIKAEFLIRGGTIAQVDLWLRLDEFRMDIATFSTLMSLGKDRDDNEKHAAWASVFDRRDELEEMAFALSDGTVLATAREVTEEEERPTGIMNFKTINENLGI